MIYTRLLLSDDEVQFLLKCLLFTDEQPGKFDPESEQVILDNLYKQLEQSLQQTKRFRENQEAGVK